MLKRLSRYLLFCVLSLPLVQCGGGGHDDDWDGDHDGVLEYDRTNLDYTMVYLTNLAGSNGINSITLDMETRTVFLNGQTYSSGNMSHTYLKANRLNQYGLEITASDGAGTLTFQTRIEYYESSRNRTYGNLKYWTMSKDGSTTAGSSGSIEVANKY